MSCNAKGDHPRNPVCGVLSDRNRRPKIRKFRGEGKKHRRMNTVGMRFAITYDMGMSLHQS
jgi:hypothetical protein